MTNNSLLLRALRKEPLHRPPVWMMRQAGRYLPQYMAIAAKYDFFTRIQTPELACEITIQPVDIVGTDAAILFSDILVIPAALGYEVQMVKGTGPFLPITVKGQADVDRIDVSGVAERLSYVYRAIELTKRALNGRVPLIGFAGAPFTILCYMVQGAGSKSFDVARRFCFEQPSAAHALLEKITQATIAYLAEQVKAGADVVQIFDSWSGLLSPTDFNDFALPYVAQITSALSPAAPVILFPRGSWYALPALARTGASAIGLDWCITPDRAREMTSSAITLQGNFDPAKLYMNPEQIQAEVVSMIDGFGTTGYIANLGHGILPDTPVENAKAFVQAVKSYHGSSNNQ